MSEERTEDRAGPLPENEQSTAATIEALRREAEDNWNKYLRTAADLDNLRKRSAREVENARKYGAERLAAAILPVRDSIEAGLAATGSEAQILLDGQRATLRLLDEALASVGIREVAPYGEPFDPAKHEALSVRPSPGTAPDTVVEVVQKGYELNDRLLRAAKVIVSSGAGPGGGGA
jgi:molecular chaperone GrpE